MTSERQKMRIITHFDTGRERKAFMLERLLLALERRPINELTEIAHFTRMISENPFMCGQECVDYRAGANLFVLWGNRFSFLYRVHKPTYGEYEKHEYVSHILAIEPYYSDNQGFRVLEIFRNPEADRIIREGEGTLIDEFIHAQPPLERTGD